MAKNDTSDPNSPLSEKLKEINTKEEEQAARQKAKKYNLPYIDLSRAPIENQAVWSIPETKAREAKLALVHTSPQKEGPRAAQVCLFDPENQVAQEIIEDLKKNFGRLNICLVSLRSLKKAWGRYQERPGEEVAITGEIDIQIEKLKDYRQKIKNINETASLIEKAPHGGTSALLEIIIAGALETSASDLHLEKKKAEALLRYRIDGILQDVFVFPVSNYELLTGRIKLLAGTKLNITDIAQDGRFTIVYGDNNIEVRVSVVPGAYGENIVMRVLNPKTISLGLEELGLRQDQLKLLEEEIKQPNGMIITTGPTGSGKTTALYACLKKVATQENKIVTLEDPIEYHIPLITQTQIEPESGYTFASGLRALLRQDPDVVLVGEIRDNETAEIAVHAALTGHLLFSTLHTNDAAGAIPRLVDIGINPTILSAALSDILAQRLVRRLCQKCKQKITAKDKDLSFLKKTIDSMPKSFKKTYQKSSYEIFKPKSKGCPHCNNTGYKGRIGVFEIVNIDKDFEKLVAKSPSHADVKELAFQKNMTSMLHDAVIKILDGITSIPEVHKIIGQR